MFTDLSFLDACATHEPEQPVDNLDEAKDNFEHADCQQEGEKDHVPEDNVFWLFANAPSGLVKQIIIPAKVRKLNWGLLSLCLSAIRSQNTCSDPSEEFSRSKGDFSFPSSAKSVMRIPHPSSDLSQLLRSDNRAIPCHLLSGFY